MCTRFYRLLAITHQTTTWWCILHVVNLIAKALIKQFDANAENNTEEAAESAVESATESVAESAAENTAESAAESTTENDIEDNSEAKDGADLESKIIEVMYEDKDDRNTGGEDSDGEDQTDTDDPDNPDDVTNPSILGPAWKQCLADLKMDYRIMPRNVTTCWNSTYDML